MLERIRKAKDEGFTLIELLIVIIILGILAAIVVFAVGSTRGDSLTATCKTDVKSIQLAEEAYKTKTGSYTTTQTDLTNGTSGLLHAWPTNDNITFGLASDASGYKITVSGGKVTGGSVKASDDDSVVNTVCAAA